MKAFSEADSKGSICVRIIQNCVQQLTTNRVWVHAREKTENQKKGENLEQEKFERCSRIMASGAGDEVAGLFVGWDKSVVSGFPGRIVDKNTMSQLEVDMNLIFISVIFLRRSGPSSTRRA